MNTQVVQLPRRRPRRRIAAPRPPRRGGRAWINGREVGGTDQRFEHLALGSD